MRQPIRDTDSHQVARLLKTKDNPNNKNNMRYKNTETRKIFDLTEGENQFDAQQVGGSGKGHISYQIRGNTMDVKNMFSVPENGSGLGSLLLFLAVKDAMAKECELVEISNAAFDARDFYFKMGCRTGTDILSDGDFTDEEREKLAKQSPIGGAAMTVLNASHASMFKKWEPA